MANQRIYGIDLGTTYSCISYIDDNGKPVTIPNFEGDLTTPSVVYFESAENIVVGKHAKNASKLDPDRVVAFVKRSMGDASFSFEVDGKTYNPEMVSSLILRKLVSDASQALGEEIEDVVITCPAYFGINQREATKNAGVLAGLNVHHILNEPTAAAICYGMDKLDQNKTVLVYDLGGGTFDITVIAIRDGGIQVIVTGGNHTLGGKDWDDRLINYFAEQFMAQYPNAGDPRDDAQSLQDIAIAAEEAKKGLTSKEKWPFMVNHDGQRARVEITREGFESLSSDLLEQTIEMTRQVLSDAAARGEATIDQVLLVGGSSKMPAVSRRLKEALGSEPQLYDPDQSVAKGAALMGLKIMAGEAIKEVIAETLGTNKEAVELKEVDARTLESAAQKVSARGGVLGHLPGAAIAELATSQVINVCSKGFGVVIADPGTGQKSVAYLISGNTSVPVECADTFGTVIPNQRVIEVAVMEQAGQVESSLVENNREIVSGNLEGFTPGLPQGSPLEVTFRLEDDGTLKVLARECTSGKELRLEAKVDGVMSPEAVAQEKHALARLSVS